MYHFFYSSRDSFSNFYKAPFTYAGLEFSCSEQLFMYAKAKLFKDNERAKRILNAKTPATMKRNGRQVKGFDPIVWDQYKEDFMFLALREKINQNSKIKQKLLKTSPALLVEASPWDTIWGVGLAKNDPLIHDPANWQGTNLLGKLLTDLRDLPTFERLSNEREQHLLDILLAE
jgi:ribA/ribD-fused uncharacterized protein